MDYCELPQDSFESHYEIIKDIDRVEAASAVKKSAFQAMDQLEGWCSKFKAGILVDLVLMLKPQNVLEIGVFGGKSLVPMGIACKANKTGTVFGIDPWAAVNSIEGMDGENLRWWGTIDHEAIYQGLVDKVNKFNLNDQILLLRTTSENAPVLGTIDILHVDGNHSEKAAYFDVTKWVPYVRQGGVVIMDDLNWEGPKKAVEWLDGHCVKLVEFNDSGSNWGIWIKK